MERRRILYLKNRTLPSLEDFSLHCRINNYLLVEGDSETFSSENISPEDFQLMLVDYPLMNRARMKSIREWKNSSVLPLIMLMDNVRETSQMEAFSEGADDIIDRKVCSERVFTLMSRMDNLIRIYGKNRNESLTSWMIGKDRISLNVRGRLVLVNGAGVHLTPTEWNILRLLSEKNGHVVSREEILSGCFEYQYEGYDRSIDAHIKNLRKKIPLCIETLRGVGYRFTGRDISQSPDPIESPLSI